MMTPRLEDLPHYSFGNYVQWEGRWELICGVPYAISPSHGIAHQAISQHIAGQLEKALENCRECHALLPVDWKIDEETTVQPYNLVVCGELENAAKVYRLHDGRYIKMMDASKEMIEFDLGKCSIRFDFDKIWL